MFTDAPIIKGVQKAETRLGATLELTCSCRGCLPINQYVWTILKAKKNVPVTHKKTTKIDEEADFFSTTLTIEKASMKDHGKFNCELENNLKKMNFSTFVQVSTQPQNISATLKGVSLHYIDRDAVITEYNTYYLKCSAFAHPVASVIWYKDGVEISNMIRENEIDLQEYELANAQGRYKCVVENTVGITSKVFQLRVAIKPVVHGLKTELIYAAANEKVSLNCDVKGVPEPQISWFLNSQPLPRDYRFALFERNKVLEFGMSADVLGSYACVATNEFGDVSKTFTMLLKGRKNK